jgi:hypothetical protein
MIDNRRRWRGLRGRYRGLLRLLGTNRYIVTVDNLGGLLRCLFSAGTKILVLARFILRTPRPAQQGSGYRRVHLVTSGIDKKLPPRVRAHGRV